MKLTKIDRAAIIAILDCITWQSEWITIPTDRRGCQYLFSRRKAAEVFGKEIKTADLFSVDGDASRLATEILWVASVHGWIADTVENTGCPHMQRAFEAMAFTDARTNRCVNLSR